MMKKIILVLMILVAVASAAAVSASDNATDIAGDGGVIDESQIEEVSEDEDSAEVSDDDSQSSNLLGASESEDVLSENNSSEVTESKITASNVVGYTSFSSTVSAVLTSNGTALASKPVKIILNGVTYNKVTDTNGKVSVSVSLAKGTYTAQFIYAGDSTTGNASATSTVKINSAIKTKLQLGDKYINYRQGSSCLFYVKLLDANGKAIQNQWVTLKVNGKTYKVKTNKNGNAKIYLSLKKENIK